MRMHSPVLVELAVVGMCESSMTFSLPLPRKFHQLYAELLIPLKDENEQDRSDLNSTIINRHNEHHYHYSKPNRLLDGFSHF